MDHRLIELLVAPARARDVQRALESHQAFEVWSHAVNDSRLLMRAVVAANKVDDTLAELGGMVAGGAIERVLLLPVQAMLPRAAEPEPDQPPPRPDRGKEPAVRRVLGGLQVSREELYAQISGSARATPVYFLLVGLSATVAIVGLEHNNVAVIIGAMVIAPLLGPNVALALATALGDVQLGRGAARTALAGVVVALAIAIAAGVLLPIDPATPEVAARSVVGGADVMLALAAGAAGALSFTTGVPATLIGVMVAVALLPPTVTFGLLLGAREFRLAGSAGLLLLINVVSVNLAAVGMFVVQGIEPMRWWEADRARRASRTAVLLWSVLLAVLSVAVWFSQRP